MSPAVFRFPAALSCPWCPKIQRVSRANFFCCADCGGTYQVSDEGKVAKAAAPNGPKTRKRGSFGFGFEFPADVDMLPVIRGILLSAARQLGASEKDVAALELALDEVITNILVHSFGFDRSKRFRVDLKADVSRRILTITLRDKGKENKKGWVVDEARALERVQQGKAGGLGRFLTSRMMDSVEYRRKGGENILTLVKKLQDLA